MRAARRLRRPLAAGGRFALLAAFVAFCAFPFYWMLITAFKSTTDLIEVSHNPLVFNAPPTLAHVRQLFVETQFGQWLLNTLAVGVAVVAITLVLAVPAGYALARLAGRGGHRLAIGIFLTYLVPPTILFIPFARIIAVLGLQDSLWSLVLVYPSFTVPFCTWLLMGYFKAIPYELEECALIDGASRWQILVKIILPLAVPGLISAGIFAFTLSWNEFIYALTFMQSSENKTVPVASSPSSSRATSTTGAR